MLNLSTDSPVQRLYKLSTDSEDARIGETLPGNNFLNIDIIDSDS